MTALESAAWPDHLPSAPRPELRTLLAAPGSAAVLIDGSRDPNSGVTVLVVPADAEEPGLAVKIATTATAAAIIAV